MAKNNPQELICCKLQPTNRYLKVRSNLLSNLILLALCPTMQTLVSDQSI